MTGPDDKDEYYKQPGHPLSSDAEKGGRFQVHYPTITFLLSLIFIYEICFLNVENQGNKVSVRSYS